MAYQSRHQFRYYCLILALFSTPVFAATDPLYLGVNLGYTRINVGDGNPDITYYGGYLNDAYPVDDHATTAIIGVHGGKEFRGHGFRPALALGLGFYNTLGNYRYNGQLIETAVGDASTTLNSYDYKVSSTRIMAEAQSSWALGRVAPFITMGIGTAWNRLTAYSEVPIDCQGCIALPPFQSHTNTSYAYQIGIGLAYAFNFGHPDDDYRHDRLSFAYRYANLGDASLGVRGFIYPYRLETGRLMSQEVYLDYTHLF